MNDWIAELNEIADRGETACIVTVAGVRGSARHIRFSVRISVRPSSGMPD